MKRVILFSLMAVALAAAETPQELFQKGLVKERSEGKLEEALQLYRRAAEAAGKDRALAAKALVQLAAGYEKLGNTESRRIYERVVREYADQQEAVTTARARLSGSATKSTGIVTRQVWKGQQVAQFASVSPDGRALSFVDQMTGNLALHDLTDGKDHPLTNKGTWSDSNEFAQESTFSPDGKQVAYAWSNNEGRYDLRIVGVNGATAATPRVLYANEDVESISANDWSPDGKWIAVKLERIDKSAQIGLVGTADGSLRTLKSVGWGDSTRMRFSPDGRYLAFDLPPSEGSRERDVFMLAVDGSREIPAVVHPADDAVVGWTPDGKHLLFTSDRSGTVSIYSLAFEDGKPQGAARHIKSDIGQGVSIGLTRSGSLYLALKPGSRDLLKASIDLESGKLLATPVPAVHSFLGTNYQPDWSPDGLHLAYTSYRRTPAVLVIHSKETGQERELRPRLRYFNFARWSPDGRSFVAPGADLKGRQGIYRIDAQSGEVEAIVHSAPGMISEIPQWAPAGKKIFYIGGAADRKNEALIERDLTSGNERKVLAGTMLAWFSVAPNGKQLICEIVDPVSKQRTLEIVEVASGLRRELLKAGEIVRPQWTPDGRFILLRKSGELWALSADGGQPRKIDLGVPRSGRIGSILDFRVHPDGRQIAFMTRNDTPHEIWVMENLIPALNAGR